jgi:uncharacterized protein YbgA (DUF1722 family)/uncharacterized protein YbbK (DUF523 family)
MNGKIRLGISSCLLGGKVRYDGGHKLDHFLRDTLGNYVDWVPVCPEVEMGLSVPREAMRLIGTPEAPRLKTIRTGKDYTDRMLKWAMKRLDQIEKEDLCGFVFKSRSPSSGMKAVKVYDESGVPRNKGTGIFAGAFMERFPLLPVEDEGRLNDPVLRENFIERIFVYQRWKDFLKSTGSIAQLITFHTKHKLLILSHSTKHYSILERLVADAKRCKTDEIRTYYLMYLMEGLRLTATIRKNTNVLQHMMGYFKDRLTSDEKEELSETIEKYHAGFVPLIVPLTLLTHYVRKFDEPYLKGQYYLRPHPAELMLRNHV